MLAHPTLDLLHALGLHGMAKGYQEIAANPEARAPGKVSATKVDDGTFRDRPGGAPSLPRQYFQGHAALSNVETDGHRPGHGNRHVAGACFPSFTGREAAACRGNRAEAEPGIAGGT